MNTGCDDNHNPGKVTAIVETAGRCYIDNVGIKQKLKASGA